MGGDPVASESVPARRAAGVRGDCRGRCRGDILGSCSYSCAGGRRRHGGGVGFFGRGPLNTVACIRVFDVPQLSAVRITVFCLDSVCFLSSLIGEMDDKDREREEN